MKTYVLPALVALALGGTAVLNAQDVPVLPGARDVSRVEAGTYAVDSGHTLVRWTVDHFGFSDYFGIFGAATGTLVLDPANLATTSLSVTIPVSQVTVANEALRDHLLRAGKDGGKPDFFGTDPADATFVSTSVRQTGEQQALINGMLTLNDVTRPIAILAEFNGAGAHPMNRKLNIGFNGRAVIKRSDFGVDFGIPIVSDEVTLDIVAAFELTENHAATPPGDTCLGGKTFDATGKQDNPELRASIAATIGHDRIRWITPGTMVTRDYRPDRLNVDIDKQGTITRAYCG